MGSCSAIWASPIASFFKNAAYARFSIDAARWPKTDRDLPTLTASRSVPPR